jgi:hypothetical protein
MSKKNTCRNYVWKLLGKFPLWRKETGVILLVLSRNMNFTTPSAVSQGMQLLTGIRYMSCRKFRRESDYSDYVFFVVRVPLNGCSNLQSNPFKSSQVTTNSHTTYSLRYTAASNLVEKRYRSAVSAHKTEAISSSKRLLVVIKQSLWVAYNVA